MRKIFSLILATGVALSLSAEVPAAYMTLYAGLAGQSGTTLFDAVSAIAATGYQSHTYKDLWTYFRTTDMRANGKIWDTYSDCDFVPGTDQCGSYSTVCDCYNREHSLPKSWFGASENTDPGNDLFHLMPTDGKVNGQRSNYAFGECSGGTYVSTHAMGKLGTSTFTGYTSAGTVFEPDDIYKGDFARNYFGMLVRYGKAYAFNQADGGCTMFSNTNKTITAANHYGLTDYSVALLMKWHRQDSVSAKETDRNDGIQATQGNRNPFIDCPVLAEYFWGTKAGQAVALQDLVDCGCADGSVPSAIAEVPAFPSMTLTQQPSAIVLGCLPDKATVSIFDASGTLLSMEPACGAEMEIALPQGFYLVLVSAPGGKQSFKVSMP